MRKLSVCLSIVLIGTAIVSNASASDFKNLMESMSKADITYERVGHYTRPFKVMKHKKEDIYFLEQQVNYEYSRIKDEGNNKISVNEFPSGWTINGTWVYSKNGALCKISHEQGGMFMTWNC